MAQGRHAERYMHVPDEVRQRIPRQIGGLLWTDQDGEEGDGRGAGAGLRW